MIHQLIFTDSLKQDVVFLSFWFQLKILSLKLENLVGYKCEDFANLVSNTLGIVFLLI